MAEKLVIYDSVFGNTEKVAQAIGEALRDAIGGAPVKKVDDVKQEDLHNLQILFVGSPTRAFRPTPAITNFLKGLDKDKLQGVKAAAFDTRIAPESIDSGFFRWFVSFMGYADKKIAKGLQKAGADLTIESDGFGVTGTEGPLAEGELERAQAWAQRIL